MNPFQASFFAVIVYFVTAVIKKKKDSYEEKQSFPHVTERTSAVEFWINLIGLT